VRVKRAACKLAAWNACMANRAVACACNEGRSA
jgi:hypothetical protein